MKIGKLTDISNEYIFLEETNCKGQTYEWVNSQREKK